MVKKEHRWHIGLLTKYKWRYCNILFFLH